MNNNFLEKNLNNLQLKHPQLVIKIKNVDSSNDYKNNCIMSKTNLPIPVLNNNKAMYSKYNPEKEAERLFLENEEFVLFCGLASGIHIRQFLKKFKKNYCAISEINFENLKFLFTRFDFTDLILNERCFFLHPLEDNLFEHDFIQTYLPVLHGKLSIKILRPWEDFYKEKIKFIQIKINHSLDKIKADFSTQSYFGKIWMKNIFANLKTASKINPRFPVVDKNKTAYILGAGPNLEEQIYKLKANKKKIILFATDTAFSVLNTYGIEADFVISIDPQIFSTSNCYTPFNSKTIAVFDVCANSNLVRQFHKNGNPLIFGTGNHPLGQLASRFCQLPNLVTAGGTVAITAKFIALSLGLKKIKYAGLDFAYTNGKAYCNETYLSKLFLATSNRFSNLESKFIDMMFRTPVEKKLNCEKITYTTKLLDSYKDFFHNSTNNWFYQNKIIALWTKEQFNPFPYDKFISKLQDFESLDLNRVTMAFLPYFSYRSKQKLQNNEKKICLDIVLSALSEYTGK